MLTLGGETAGNALSVANALVVFVCDAGAEAKASSAKPPRRSTSATGAGAGRGAVGFRVGARVDPILLDRFGEVVTVSSSPALYSSYPRRESSLNPEPLEPLYEPL